MGQAVAGDAARAFRTVGGALAARGADATVGDERGRRLRLGHAMPVELDADRPVQPALVVAEALVSDPGAPEVVRPAGTAALDAPAALA
jgi:hypothetical protein